MQQKYSFTFERQIAVLLPHLNTQLVTKRSAILQK